MDLGFTQLEDRVLNSLYARKMDDGTIRHYKVPVSLVLTEMTLSEMYLLDHLLNVEGIEAKDVTIVKAGNDGELKTVDMYEQVLKGRSKARKALLKNKVSNESSKLSKSIMAYMRPTTVEEAIVHNYTVKNSANFNNMYDAFDDAFDDAGMEIVNRLGIEFKVPSRSYSVSTEKETSLGLVRFNLLAHKLGISSLIPKKWRTVTTKASCAVTLSYSYRVTEGDGLVNEKEAIRRLGEDLDTLAEAGSILGHLVMPFSLGLNDSVGDGSQLKALCCILFFNPDIVSNINVEEFCEGLGIKSYTKEGDLGPLVGEDFKTTVEIVEVRPDGFLTQEQRFDAVLANYNRQRAAINKLNKERTSRKR